MKANYILVRDIFDKMEFFLDKFDQNSTIKIFKAIITESYECFINMESRKRDFIISEELPWSYMEEVIYSKFFFPNPNIFACFLPAERIEYFEGELSKIDFKLNNEDGAICS